MEIMERAIYIVYLKKKNQFPKESFALNKGLNVTQ